MVPRAQRAPRTDGVVGNAHRHSQSGLSQPAEVPWDKPSRKHPPPPSYQQAGTPCLEEQ